MPMFNKCQRPKWLFRDYDVLTWILKNFPAFAYFLYRTPILLQRFTNSPRLFNKSVFTNDHPLKITNVKCMFGINPNIPFIHVFIYSLIHSFIKIFHDFNIFKVRRHHLQQKLQRSLLQRQSLCHTPKSSVAEMNELKLRKEKRTPAKRSLFEL